MAETIVYECGHCDGKGVCGRVTNQKSSWSCVSCLRAAGWRFDAREIVKCSVCGGSGKIVKIVKN